MPLPTHTHAHEHQDRGALPSALHFFPNLLPRAPPSRYLQPSGSSSRPVLSRDVRNLSSAAALFLKSANSQLIALLALSLLIHNIPKARQTNYFSLSPARFHGNQLLLYARATGNSQLPFPPLACDPNPANNDVHFVTCTLLGNSILLVSHHPITQNVLCKPITVVFTMTRLCKY